MNKNIGMLFGVALLLGIAALTAIGLRIAPMEQPANSAESRQTCEVDAPDALRPSAREWCANGLFANIRITEQPENVITVAQFNTNGSHMWQLQSSNLLGSFRMLTEKIAANAGGRNVAVSIQDGADERIASCARRSTDTAATCKGK